MGCDKLVYIDCSYCSYPWIPAECSGPPHLLGPWGRPAPERIEWPPRTNPFRAGHYSQVTRSVMRVT